MELEDSLTDLEACDYTVAPPAILNTLGVIDGHASKLYPVARDYLLPSALVLLCIAIDFGAIVRLGPKAIVMFLTGTVGIMFGAVASFEIMRLIHPETVAGETWRGMTTVTGAWIGGGANQAAMKEVFEVDATLFGQFVAVDVLVANVWMAVLLFLALLVKLSSPGPVFYAQERVGLNGKSFWVLKYRSMRTDAESKTGPIWASRGSSRARPRTASCACVITSRRKSCGVHCPLRSGSAKSSARAAAAAIAACAATSPPAWPPMPSATAQNPSWSIVTKAS